MSGRLRDTDRFHFDPCRVMTESGRTPDPWQRRVLESHAQRLLILGARQFGKSEVGGALVARAMIVEAPAFVILLSASQQQATEFFQRKVLPVFQRLGWPVKPKRPPNVQSMELANGSRVIALPDNEETVVGYSDVSLLLIDEASRVSDGLYHYTSPMLAVSRGRLVALSTPKGKRGWFHDEWAKGAGWERHRATVLDGDCPRIPAEFLADQRRAKGERLYAQEYLGQFNDLSGSYFSGDDIDAALSPLVEPLFPEGW